MYGLQSTKLLTAFESLRGSISAAPHIMKPKCKSRAAVEPNKQEQIMESSPNPKALVCLLTKWKTAVLVAETFRIRSSDHIDIKVPQVDVPISKTLVPPNKWQYLLGKLCNSDVAYHAMEVHRRAGDDRQSSNHGFSWKYKPCYRFAKRDNEQSLLYICCCLCNFLEVHKASAWL